MKTDSTARSTALKVAVTSTPESNAACAECSSSALRSEGSCPATAAHRNGCPPAARGRLGQGAPNRNLRNGYVKRSAAFLPLCRRRTANARRLLVFRPETACRVQRKIQDAQERHRRFLLKTAGRLKGWFQSSYNRRQLY